MSKAEDLSQLPSMTVLLAAVEADDGLRKKSRGVVTEALREVMDAIRQECRAGKQIDGSVQNILSRAKTVISERGAIKLVGIINATGVILHTGLGRSILPAAAIERVNDAAAGYCNLEIDLHTGKRGRRGQYAEQMLCQLTGAESALVVNNNAAATMLVLAGLARGREVIVSRGQLIEIGGSYRLPEVMSAGGAILREVGTTNKTHLSDYEKAISDRTALIMHVHTSNYRVVGFAESPDVTRLAELAHRHRLPLFDDLGSGALIENDFWSAANEPTATVSLKNGADILAFSGDKLLGGPQSGILLGSRTVIDRLHNDPMARALRIGKLTAAALEATLELYQHPERLPQEIPTLAMLHDSIEILTVRAESLATMLRTALKGHEFIVASDESFAGGGSLPAYSLPTAVVQWRPKPVISTDELARRLRMGTPAVLVRIHEGALLFDARTIREMDVNQLTDAVKAAALQ